MAVVAVATLESDVYSKLRTLMVANKPTYTDPDGSTQTYSIVATFPEDNPTFPLIVLNPANVKMMLLNLDGSGEDYGVEVHIEFYAKVQHGKNAIDRAMATLRNTFVGNLSNFDTNDGLLPQEEFWETSNMDSFQDKNQLLNTASAIVRFKLK